MALQEPLFVIRQTRHVVDVRVYRLPLLWIKRRLGQPDLRACRVLALKMFGVAWASSAACSGPAPPPPAIPGSTGGAGAGAAGASAKAGATAARCLYFRRVAT
jgi:hypothetical protein